MIETDLGAGGLCRETVYESAGRERDGSRQGAVMRGLLTAGCAAVGGLRFGRASRFASYFRIGHLTTIGGPKDRMKRVQWFKRTRGESTCGWTG